MGPKPTYVWDVGILADGDHLVELVYLDRSAFTGWVAGKIVKVEKLSGVIDDTLFTRRNRSHATQAGVPAVGVQ